jgi:hypothetical protein
MERIYISRRWCSSDGRRRTDEAEGCAVGISADISVRADIDDMRTVETVGAIKVCQDEVMWSCDTREISSGIVTKMQESNTALQQLGLPQLPFDPEILLRLLKT